MNKAIELVEELLAKLKANEEECSTFEYKGITIVRGKHNLCGVRFYNCEHNIFQGTSVEEIKSKIDKFLELDWAKLPDGSEMLTYRGFIFIRAITGAIFTFSLLQSRCRVGLDKTNFLESFDYEKVL